MADRSEQQPRDWVLSTIIVIGFVLDISSRLYGGSSDTKVTAGQVVTLTEQVRSSQASWTDQMSKLAVELAKLRDKITDMPHPEDWKTYASRLDNAEAKINELQQKTGVLRNDMDHLLQPVYPDRRR